MNLDLFKKSVIQYLRITGTPQNSLAMKVGLSREALSRKLNGKLRITEEDINAIIRALATMRAITTRQEALHLLQIAGVRESFISNDQWSIPPLSLLSSPSPIVKTLSRTATSFDDVSPIWNVPFHRNPYFTGRDDLFDQLDQRLTPRGQATFIASHHVALTQHYAIKGLGGIGKTQIAVEYAYRSRESGRYTHTLWVNAASKEMIFASFTNIAALLPSVVTKDGIDQHKLVEAVIRWLEECENPWLLIFDNADEFALLVPYLPHRGNGSILLTTRSHIDFPIAVSLEVDNMSLMESTKLLLSRARRFDHALQILDEDKGKAMNAMIDESANQIIDEATNLVIVLDQFPLALDQAGAYINETGCSFADYLKIYEAHRKELLTRRGFQIADYPASTATTWFLAFQKVEEINPAAAELLHLCAFLAPNRIPEELITAGTAHWPPLLQQATADLFTFNQMIQDLLKFSLVKRLTETRVLSLDRLVQTAQIDMMSSETQLQWAERIVRAINDLFPQDPQDPATWSQCFRYLDQVQMCYALIEQYKLTFIEAADVLNRVGIYLYAHGLYALIEPLYQRALAIREQQLGPTHLDTATSLDNLAELYRVQSRYSEAESLYQQALAIYERQPGLEHSRVASTVNGLANLYNDQAKYEQAEPLYQRALAIYERQSGPEHPNVAHSLNGLANLYRQQGKYAQAELLYQRALHIREQQLGSEHPETAETIHDLARFWETQGNSEEASAWYARALAAREQALGKCHPKTIETRTHFIALLQTTGHHEEAIQLEETQSEL